MRPPSGSQAACRSARATRGRQRGRSVTVQTRTPIRTTDRTIIVRGANDSCLPRNRHRSAEPTALRGVAGGECRLLGQ